MTRRKVILPYWTPSKEDASNKEALKNKFGDLSQGELIINNSTEGSYLTILDSNDNPSTFDSSKVADAKISESFESATTFAVSAITETKTELTDAISEAKEELTSAITETKAELTTALSEAKEELTSAITETKAELTDAISSATTYTDSLIEAVYESATTFAVSAITEAKTEITNTVSLGLFEKGEGENSAVLKGVNCEAKNNAEVAIGDYNKSNISMELSGRTRFSVGIGTENERKNAFEVRENGDIYIAGFNASLQQNLSEALNGGNGTSGNVSTEINATIEQSKNDAIASASAYADESILAFYQATVLNLKYVSSENKVYYKGYNTLEWSELLPWILGINISKEHNTGVTLGSVNMYVIDDTEKIHIINDFNVYLDETNAPVLTWNFNGKKYTWYKPENIITEDIGNNGNININPYNEGSGITIENNIVHVNVDEDSFLKINEENELTVTGVTLDAAVTSKDITIEGGQWANAVKTVFTGGTVPAGTTWQSFLESMLCVEKFDTSYSMSKAFTVTCGTLGKGISGATNNTSVEVGTKVLLKAFSANSTTASQSYTVSAFDYGYKLGEDGVYNPASAYTETLTPSFKASNDALTATFTKFVDESGNTIAKISGKTSMEQVNMRVMDGANTVVIAQTGDTYTASSAVTAGTIYVATNLKNYYKSDKKTPNTYTPSYTSEDKTATASTTYTVTGYRNTFYGTTTKTDASNAAFIRTSLTKSNKEIATGNTISFNTNSSDGHLRMVIASPRTIKSVKNQTGTQDLTALLVGTKKTDTVGGVDNFAPISYNIYDYTWKSAFGNETWIITFA